MLGHPHELVGPHDDQDPGVAGSGQPVHLVEELGLQPRGVADGVQLLELVDHEEPAAGSGIPFDRPGQLGPGIVAGRDDGASPATAVGERTVGQRSEHARAHQRRLAAARGSNDREQVAGRQPNEQLRDQSLAPEEHGRVVLLVTGQAAIRVHVLLAWFDGTVVTVTPFQELAQAQHRIGGGGS